MAVGIRLRPCGTGVATPSPPSPQGLPEEGRRQCVKGLRFHDRLALVGPHKPVVIANDAGPGGSEGGAENGSSVCINQKSGEGLSRQMLGQMSNFQSQARLH